MSVDAWRQFVAGDRDLAIAEELLASWKRSRAAGVDPEAPAFHRVPERDVEHRLAIHGALVGIAASHLSWLSRELDDEVHAVCVVDADGIVLWATGEAALLERMRMSTGYDWSEARMGTNGAGTPIATGDAITLGRGEHYCRLWHDLASVGTAVKGRAGDVLGAIELVSPACAQAGARSLAVAHVGRAIQREHAVASEVATAHQARAPNACATRSPRSHVPSPRRTSSEPCSRRACSRCRPTPAHSGCARKTATRSTSPERSA